MGDRDAFGNATSAGPLANEAFGARPAGVPPAAAGDAPGSPARPPGIPPVSRRPVAPNRRLIVGLVKSGPDRCC
ncbi:MAG: hypothetical protein JWN65_894 [Solirubrobacterales bacterium]|nr:hypothetical protein [Solirubrobacterales bacterium]